MIDHNYLTVAIFLLATVLAVIGVLLREWVKHVNENVARLWERLDEESKSREDRWNSLHVQCYEHGARIAKIEGKINKSDN